MVVTKMKTAKCPSDEHALTNCAAVNSKDFDLTTIQYCEITTGPNQHYVFTLMGHESVSSGYMGFSLAQRKWAMLSLNQDIEVKLYPKPSYLGRLVLEVNFANKKTATSESHNTDDMARDFTAQFSKHSLALSLGQQLVLNFLDKKLLSLVVQSIEVVDITGSQTKQRQDSIGVIYGNTQITFQKAEGSSILLTGKSQGKTVHQSIIPQDWDFNKMGIGGLDKEFMDIFRRAFASRVFPPDLVEQLGIKHVRGMLLFGPPGTGKTLIARQIGKMLNAREPKIINGPQILDKYVGESEANIRKLFQDAEDEQKKCGNASGLHIIIFDEIDAICKSRGSVTGSSAVHDTVVNQLLSKIDGYEEMNNILIIGMTNRKDMIDEALLRPGRLEVQMEIGLPDEQGRVQVLNIHTAQIRENKKLAADVNILALAARTKNFSGAELAGLVRAATSTAMNRLIKATNKVELDVDAQEKLQITNDDFMQALEDIKPAFGATEESLDTFIANGIFNWGEPVSKVLEDGELLLSQAKGSGRTPLVTLLLEGASQSGKTALAAQIAKMSGFPFLRVCTPEKMVGYHEAAKCQAIKAIFEDSYKSPLSLIIVDDIERLLDYAPIGPKYSNLVLQTLLVLLKKLPPKGRKLMVIGTTSRKDVLRDLDMLDAFSAVVRVQNISRSQDLVSALDLMESFNQSELAVISRKLDGKSLSIGIKKLLVLVEMAKQMSSGQQVDKFISLLQDEGAVDY